VIILDENIVDEQRQLLLRWRIRIHRFLRQSRFDTEAKRMGKVIRLSSAGISLWQLNTQEETFLDWT